MVKGGIIDLRIEERRYILMIGGLMHTKSAKYFQTDYRKSPKEAWGAMQGLTELGYNVYMAWTRKKE